MRVRTGLLAHPELTAPSHPRWTVAFAENLKGGSQQRGLLRTPGLVPPVTGFPFRGL